MPRGKGRGSGADPGIGATAEITMILTNNEGANPVVSEGSSLLSYIETKDLYSDSQEVIKFVQRLRYIIRDLSATFTVYFKTRNHSDDDYVVSEAQTLTGEYVSVRLPGAKFVRVVFEDPNPATRWLLSEFELMGQVGGRRDYA